VWKTRERLALTLALALIVPLIVAPATAVGVTADGPRATAADGTVQTIDAINPSSRTAGLFALYTPSFGSSTKTNQYGGEAVLRKAGGAGAYQVVSVCTALTTCPKPGDNDIPADGVVLSASPGGTPDVRVFLRDHVQAGDVLQLAGLTTRTVTATVDAVDPTATTNTAGVDPVNGQCYPGCRGAEQLIVYTSTSARPTTGTNDYGFEVTVSGGRVTARGGNDRVIPADGMVLSGHGGRGAWLSSNAVLGAKVDLAGSGLTITIDETTYFYGVEQALAKAEGSIVSAERSCLDAPLAEARAAKSEAETLLAQARVASEAHNVDYAVELAEQARGLAEVAWYRTAESRPVEGRGVWVRPTETTPAKIEATLDKIDAAGFNIVFLETIFQGYTIYPSAVAAAGGIPAQRPSMAGFDPLKVWVDGAHRRGIELHPWVESFFVGSQSENGGPGPVLTAHPQWAAVEREDVGKTGPQPSSQEVGYYFLDPAIPEARAYVEALYQEILTKYEVDGLHLDYIRYPVSQPWETAGFSYSDFARAAFKAENGVDPYSLTPDDALWSAWNSWREKQVTSFVAEVREMQQQVAPRAQVSAAVFADPADALTKKFQNWSDWVAKGYVDVLAGMSFGTSADSVARDTATMRTAVGDRNLLYTATYGPFRASTPDVVVDQIQAVRDAGSDGAALFAYNQLSGAQALSLAEGPFRAKATTPHSDLSAAARTSARWTAGLLADATGRCIPARIAKDLRKDLSAADHWLRIGKPDRAAEAYSAGASRVSHAADVVQPEFAKRVLRDLDMYRRWSLRAAELG
jgi:uncharacterized lipoprotein YddW (UPF0748 family)